MRFFIALEIPEADKEQIKQVQAQLKTLIPRIKLTDPEKLHLTIAFIGEQDLSIQDALITAMKNAEVGIGPFSIIPAYLDGFPHLHTAHILWIGIKGDIDKLYRLRHHIKDGLENIKLGVDHRRYVPHIAIGKLNNFNLTPNLEKEFERIMSIQFNPITVSSIKLFESIPEHGLHSHNTLAEIKL
ncbi:RNA 2',3'-cyclic phosphodiesterase [Candidatus Daviesbacteria bacterium]|nr:RNA 2',3'-cyclic phosphodiesterase [Candidatus Daviesbacteria bacterium]